MNRAEARAVLLLPVALVVASCGGEPAGPPIPTRPVATSVEILSGTGQTGLPGTWLPESIVIRITDQNGQPFPAALVTFRPSDRGETTQDRPASGFDGRIAVQWKLGSRVGPQHLDILVDGIPGSADVSAEGVEMDPVDLVRVSGAPTGLYGVLASGTTAFGNVLDHRATSSQIESPAGDFRTFAGAGRSEVAFFTPGAPPLLILDPWTDGPDVLETEFLEPTLIPITVWIMETPFEATRTRVLRDIDYTEEIYADEGLGIVFDLEIVDVTATEGIANLMLFDCSKSTATEETVGHRDERLNLYYVTTVDGGIRRGVTCPIGGNFVAMAGEALRDLLSHEIGHMLGLLHIDSAANFGTTNVMHSASSARRYLTEGQVFRAHWDFRSVLNGTLDTRPEEQLRGCLGQFDPTRCPSVDSRLFADGGIVATARRLELGDSLTRLDRALLRRCSTGDATDFDLGYDPTELLEVFRTGPSGSLRSLLESEAGSTPFLDQVRGIREEALRLLVLSGDDRATGALDEASSDGAGAFSGVVEWGRDRLTSN